MAELLESNKIFYTPYEPKLKNRFIMEIAGIPAFTIKTAQRPQITFDEVVDLEDRIFQPGYYTSNWNASAYASGIYFITMRSDSFVSTQKVMLVK